MCTPERVRNNSNTYLTNPRNIGLLKKYLKNQNRTKNSLRNNTIEKDLQEATKSLNTNNRLGASKGYTLAQIKNMMGDF